MAIATVPQCADALWKAHGNVTKAAKLIGCSRTALSGRIGRNKSLKKAQIESKEQLLDYAEDALWSLIADKNLGAICFALKCQGKHRGWIESPLFQGNGNSVAELAESMKKVAGEMLNTLPPGQGQIVQGHFGKKAINE